MATYTRDNNKHRSFVSPSVYFWTVVWLLLPLDAYLVAINDAQEQEWLHNIFGNRPCWIGLTDAVKEGEWKWTSGEPVEYTSWATEEPNNLYLEGEHYAMMNWNGLPEWNDLGLESPEWHTVQRAIIEQVMR